MRHVVHTFSEQFDMHFGDLLERLNDEVKVANAKQIRATFLAFYFSGAVDCLNRVQGAVGNAKEELMDWSGGMQIKP